MLYFPVPYQDLYDFLIYISNNLKYEDSLPHEELELKRCSLLEANVCFCDTWEESEPEISTILLIIECMLKSKKFMGFLQFSANIAQSKFIKDIIDFVIFCDKIRNTPNFMSSMKDKLIEIYRKSLKELRKYFISMDFLEFQNLIKNQKAQKEGSKGQIKPKMEYQDTYQISEVDITLFGPSFFEQVISFFTTNSRFHKITADKISFEELNSQSLYIEGNLFKIRSFFVILSSSMTYSQKIFNFSRDGWVNCQGKCYDQASHKFFTENSHPIILFIEEVSICRGKIPSGMGMLFKWLRGQ